MRGRSIRTFTVGSIVLLLLLIAPATATMIPVSTGGLVQSSDVIIIGEAVDSWSYWAENDTVILTGTAISVHSVLKGDAPGTLIIITRGGVVGDVRMWVENEPVISPGFTYGIFLDPQGGDTFSVQGNYQGAYLVCSEPAPGSRDGELPCMSPEDFAREVSVAPGSGEAGPYPGPGPSGTLVPGTGTPGLSEAGDEMPGTGAQGTRTPGTLVSGTPESDGLALAVIPVVQGPAEILASQAAAGSPVIMSIVPDTGSAGTGSAVTLHGQGFGTKASRDSPADVRFTFDATYPIWASGRCDRFPEWQTANQDAILEWTDTRIVVNIPVGWVNIGSFRYPGGASSGPVSVITDDGVQSNEMPFSVTFSYSTAQWEYPEVLYVIVSDDDRVVAPIMAAAETWSSVPDCGFELVFAAYEQGGESQPSMNGRNEIVFGTTSSPDIIAEATRWISSQDVYPRGYNIECDLVFNRDINWSFGYPGPGQFDIETFALHEFGHWVGLTDLYGDIPGFPSDVHKVMYGWGGPGIIKRTLTDEDMAGIRYIYPNATPTPTVLPTPTTTDSPTSIPEPTASPTPTGTEIPTGVPNGTPTGTSEPTATPTPTATEILTVVTTATPTGTPEPTATPTPTATEILTAVPTATPTGTPEPTLSPVPTPTGSPTVPPTPAPTASPMPTVPSPPASSPEAISLKSGWNFISVPGPLADGMNTAGVVFAGVDTGGRSVYLYNAETRTWEAMTAASIVKPHQGIWIYSVHAMDVPLTFKSGGLVTPTITQVY